MIKTIWTDFFERWCTLCATKTVMLFPGGASFRRGGLEGSTDQGFMTNFFYVNRTFVTVLLLQE